MIFAWVDSRQQRPTLRQLATFLEVTESAVSYLATRAGRRIRADSSFRERVAGIVRTLLDRDLTL